MKALILTSLLVLSSCNNKLVQKKVWINSYKTPCMGLVQQECFLMQESDQIDPDHWTYLYDPIEGFDFKEGKVVQLLISEKQLAAKDIPADASNIKRKMVKVLQTMDGKQHKTQPIPEEINIHPQAPRCGVTHIDISQGKETWIAETVLNRSFIGDEKAPYIKIVNGGITGSDGCNRINSKIVKLNHSDFKIGGVMQTRMACPNLQEANIFAKTLEKSDHYVIFNSSKLILFDKDNRELIVFTKK